MANNIPAFQTELLNLLQATTNLDAATKQKLRDRCVLIYQPEWLTFLGGQADTAARRGQFFALKTADYWRTIYREGSARENAAATPPPEVLE
jgi:hypothetical protein